MKDLNLHRYDGICSLKRMLSGSEVGLEMGSQTQRHEQQSRQEI